MILCDSDIRKQVEWGKLGIYPFDPTCVQPASYDLHLGDTFSTMQHGISRIDPYKPIPETTYHRVTVAPGATFLLRPGSFVLASTSDEVRIPPNMRGELDGKSSLARLGLVIHQTGGFIDPGFDGTITLELTTVAPAPMILRPGMKIAQISFTVLTKAAEAPYGSEGLGSKYQHQEGATESLYHLNEQ